MIATLRDYKDDLGRIAEQLADPDIDLEISATAHRHGKQNSDVHRDLQASYPIQWHTAKSPEMPRHDCKILNLADVEPERISWLWRDRIPLGMFSLLGGPPGVGKSTIAFSMAAIVSTGGTWPFSLDRAEPGHVIILTAEDDPKYTIVPRLIAAGADRKRISVIESVARLVNDEQVIDAPLLLSEDMHQLHAVLDQYPDIRLLIFDPLSAYLGAKDSHKDADVRQVLGPLTDLAAKHAVAILGITHLSKNAANSALTRFMGSTGIIAAARSAYLAVRHEDELMMLPVKSNVARGDVGGLIYENKSTTIAGDIETSCISWTGQTDTQADTALAQQSNRSPKLMEATDFLEGQLQDGPVRQPEIQKAAEQSGISWATVRKAKDALKVHSHKDRFSGGWKWYSANQWAMKKEQENE